MPDKVKVKIGGERGGGDPTSFARNRVLGMEDEAGNLKGDEFGLGSIGMESLGVDVDSGVGGRRSASGDGRWALTEFRMK